MYDDADNENAKHLLASKELWEELMFTREALDVSVDMLKLLKEKAYLTEYAQRVIDKALDKITTLEQRIKR